MPDPMKSLTDMRRYSNALRLMSERRIDEMTNAMVNGDMSLADWQYNMRQELKTSALQQYVTGDGGDKSAIDPVRYLTVARELKKQYGYLSRFGRAVKTASDAGKPLDFAVNRAKLYALSTQALFWKSAVPVTLPQYPRDGRTECRTNCKCRLEVDYEHGADGEVATILVYWKLGIADHCADCVRLSRKWRPLRIPYSGEASLEAAVRTLVAVDELEPHAATLLFELFALSSAQVF